MAWGHYKHELPPSSVRGGKKWRGLFQSEGHGPSNSLSHRRNAHVLYLQGGAPHSFGSYRHETEVVTRGGGTSTRLSATVDNVARQEDVGVDEVTAAAVATAEVHGSSEDVVIIKPERDDRSYRYFQLPNGLAVVAVSDPMTETASASMFIRVGHMQDPEELAGMAHFHEHSKLLQASRQIPRIMKFPQAQFFDPLWQALLYKISPQANRKRYTPGYWEHHVQPPNELGSALLLVPSCRRPHENTVPR